jgi:hypothetical protein
MSDLRAIGRESCQRRSDLGPVAFVLRSDVELDIGTKSSTRKKGAARIVSAIACLTGM